MAAAAIITRYLAYYSLLMATGAHTLMAGAIAFAQRRKWILNLGGEMLVWLDDNAIVTSNQNIGRVIRRFHHGAGEFMRLENTIDRCIIAAPHRFYYSADKPWIISR